MENALEIYNEPNTAIHSEDSENSEVRKTTESTSSKSHSMLLKIPANEDDLLDNEEGEEEENEEEEDDEDQDEEDYIIVNFDSSDEEDKTNDGIQSVGNVHDLGAVQNTVELTKISSEINCLQSEPDSISVVDSLKTKTDAIPRDNKSNTENDFISITNVSTSAIIKTETLNEGLEENQTENSQHNVMLDNNSILNKKTFRPQIKQEPEEKDLDALPSCSNAEGRGVESFRKIEMTEETMKIKDENPPEKDVTSKIISPAGGGNIDELTSALLPSPLGEETLSKSQSQIQSLIKQLGLKSKVKVSTNEDGTNNLVLHIIVNDSTNLNELVPKLKESLASGANSTSNNEVSSTVPDPPEMESSGLTEHVDPIVKKEPLTSKEMQRTDVSSTEKLWEATNLSQESVSTSTGDGQTVETNTYPQDDVENAEEIAEGKSTSNDVICLSSDEEMEHARPKDKRSVHVYTQQQDSILRNYV